MERSFKEEVAALRLGDGETFHGEGILAVTKALLQSGVSYVGGYQGAPISHLVDVLNDARDLLPRCCEHLSKIFIRCADNHTHAFTGFDVHLRPDIAHARNQIDRRRHLRL